MATFTPEQKDIANRAMDEVASKGMFMHRDLLRAANIALGIPIDASKSDNAFRLADNYIQRNRECGRIDQVVRDAWFVVQPREVLKAASEVMGHPVNSEQFSNLTAKQRGRIMEKMTCR